jgi:hypothetical protein
MRDTSTVNLAKKKKNLIKNVNVKAITQYIEILLWKPKPGTPTFLERYALL